MNYEVWLTIYSSFINDGYYKVLHQPLVYLSIQSFGSVSLVL